MTNAEKFKEVFGFEADVKSCPIRIECEDCERCPYYQKGTFEEECARRFWLSKYYKGEPTIPLSVIEKITQTMEVEYETADELADRLSGEDEIKASFRRGQASGIKVVKNIIDKAVKEIEQ